MSEALGRRHALDTPDRRCMISARIALAALADAVEGWIANGCSTDLSDAVDDSFETVGWLCHEWSGS